MSRNLLKMIVFVVSGLVSSQMIGAAQEEKEVDNGVCVLKEKGWRVRMAPGSEDNYPIDPVTHGPMPCQILTTRGWIPLSSVHESSLPQADKIQLLTWVFSR